MTLFRRDRSATTDDVVEEIKISNQFLEAILSKVSQILNVIAVEPNAPPQYTGPSTINDLVVGTGRQLQGFDPDGDTIVWSVDPANAAQVTVSPQGVLTATVPLGAQGAPVAVTVWMDDGKTKDDEEKTAKKG